jgi:hypothetical protein
VGAERLPLVVQVVRVVLAVVVVRVALMQAELEQQVQSKDLMVVLMHTTGLMDIQPVAVVVLEQSVAQELSR